MIIIGLLHEALVLITLQSVGKFDFLSLTADNYRKYNGQKLKICHLIKFYKIN
jgi:hypothetical protein